MNKPAPGQGCRSKSWPVAAVGLAVVDSKSSRSLKEAPLQKWLKHSQGRE